jgi:hypothetical protein
MPVKTYSIVANTTPDSAYAYVADITKHAEWSPDDLKVEGPSTPSVGAKYETVGHLQGKPNPSIVEITDLQPTSRIAFTSTDKSQMSSWLHEFTLTPQGGGTRIDRKVSVISAPFMLKLIFPILHPFVIGPGNMKSMNMLKDKLESHPS